MKDYKCKIGTWEFEGIYKGDSLLEIYQTNNLFYSYFNLGTYDVESFENINLEDFNNKEFKKLVLEILSELEAEKLIKIM